MVVPAQKETPVGLELSETKGVTVGFTVITTGVEVAVFGVAQAEFDVILTET